MAELKPCPFCGGEPRLFVNGGVRVLCTRCYVGTIILTDEIERDNSAVERVTEMWDRRVNDD